MAQFTAVPDMHLWSQSIGGLIINFGGIEFQSLRWIQILGGETDVVNARKLPLLKRIDTALAQLENSNLSAIDRDTARKLWSEVKQLSKMRNRIAHNPLCRGTDQDTKQITFSVVDLQRMTSSGENILEPLSYQDIASSALRAGEINRLLNSIIESQPAKQP
ncbi:MAG: hypothetical protein WBP54_04705 [Pelodictyon phaeoclathratiforme]|jgi:hypothetical protein